MTAALEFIDVSIAYARKGDEPLRILSNSDLTVREGRMHCVAGRSGSGKTSVLRVAAGLVRPSAGRVEWDGSELDGLSDDAVTALRRDHVGYLDQGGSLIPGLTVIENILLPAVPTRKVKDLGPHAGLLLEELGLAGLGNARPADLSGGQRQRAALARALLCSPRLLIVDEPTASLDRASADEVIALLMAQRDAGMAVLVASHDPHIIDAADLRTHLA
jgi:ABC-type lipoprotein export system ATPase subunit